MHFFELHIGDHEAATAHLSMLEDGALGRMRRVYHHTEKPLPADAREVCRLVRAVTKPERDAVGQVLAEFFELQPDGYHHPQWDAAIERYKAGEPEREAKKAHEDSRLKRHREERSVLFKHLKKAGQHPPYDLPIGELRALVKVLPETAPATLAQPLHETAPATLATANHKPVTKNQEPEQEMRSVPDGPAQADAFAAGTADEAQGLKAEETEDAQVFKEGMALLGNDARGLIGKWKRDFGASAVLQALFEAMTQKPERPVPWITAMLIRRAKAGSKGAPRTFSGQAYPEELPR